jgi:hypothetical protein
MSIMLSIFVPMGEKLNPNTIWLIPISLILFTSCPISLIVPVTHSVSSTTGWPVGFWAAELTHAYKLFLENGYDITIASPKGGRVEVDALSDPRDSSGYSKDDTISLGYLNDRNFMSLLDNTSKVSDLSSNDFDAIVVVGGQGPMFTFRNESGLQNTFLEFYNKGKVSAALCHATSSKHVKFCNIQRARLLALPLVCCL